MKKRLPSAVMAFGMLCMTACSDGGKEQAAKIDNISKQFSYIVGLEMIYTLEELKTVTIDREAFLQGIEDGLAGNTPMLSPDQMTGVKALVSQQEREFHNKRIAAAAEKNLNEQKAFLADNRDKEGVVVTASGLQYTVLRKGDGPRPEAVDNVQIHMVGKLLDGTVFESTYQRGTPVWVKVAGVIPAWEEALTMMNVGSKYRFFIPSELAHGKEGNFLEGGVIGPNAMLIVDLELLAIQEKSD
ncbi:peptidylprolyl isomerase FKBP-type [Desulfosudis oleivorans Hxd3]|uniref:Peptidyl-prolyl cis-trans isomerase n=2 Tax=Desulfosudis TaxID=2904716 RepID=A8ZVM6_DESOH|nr:peptidylprolyl isomerase FKBP-type [Desulfosudis oleivorans Hxd3]